jgi:hypothetical protein
VDRVAQRRAVEASDEATTVWLCAPRATIAEDHFPTHINSGHPDSGLTDSAGVARVGSGAGDESGVGRVWARRLVAEYSHRGERVLVQAWGAHPSLPGEVAALIDAAAAQERAPLALLPTQAGATRTRSHLTQLARPGDSAGRAPAGRPPAQRGMWGQVSVGRRRIETHLGGVGLVVVVTAPVCTGARASRRRISPRQVAAWARPLRPGGVLVVLRAADIGDRRARVQSHSHVVDAARTAGLRFLQHVVLVHVPAGPEGLTRPSVTRLPHALFAPVHTDALVLQAPDEPDPDQSGLTGGHDQPSRAVQPVPLIPLGERLSEPGVGEPGVVGLGVDEREVA